MFHMGRPDTNVPKATLNTAEMSRMRERGRNKPRSYIRRRDIRHQGGVRKNGEWKTRTGMTPFQIRRVPRDNSPEGWRSPGRQHRRWNDLKTAGTRSLQTKNKLSRLTITK
jgi:hypothetical protein